MHTVYIYNSELGNMVVDVGSDWAKCPIIDCDHTEHAVEHLIGNLCTHIRAKHGLDYSSFDSNPKAGEDSETAYPLR